MENDAKNILKPKKKRKASFLVVVLDAMCIAFNAMVAPTGVEPVLHG